MNLTVTFQAKNDMDDAKHVFVCKDVSIYI